MDEYSNLWHLTMHNTNRFECHKFSGDGSNKNEKSSKNNKWLYKVRAQGSTVTKVHQKNRKKAYCGGRDCSDIGNGSQMETNDRINLASKTA